MTLQTPAIQSAMTWDLSELFDGPNDLRIDETLSRGMREAEAFAARFRGTIDVAGGPTPTHLSDALSSLERLLDGVYRVGGYSHLIFTGDTTKPEHRDLEQKVRV